MTAMVRVSLTSNGSSTGEATISLPFGVANIMTTTSVQGSATIGFLDGFAGTYFDVSATPWEGFSYFKIYYRSSSGAGTVVATQTQIADDFDSRITIQFMTT